MMRGMQGWCKKHSPLAVPTAEIDGLTKAAAVFGDVAGSSHDRADTEVGLGGTHKAGYAADWKLFPISRHNLGFFASYFEVHLQCIPYWRVMSIP